MKNAKFSIAVFCLMIIVMADAANAKNFTINPTDKFLEIDGKKTFIITVVGLCNKYDKPATPCELQNQPFNIEVYGRAFGYQYAYPQDAPNATIRDLFEAANVYYTIPVYSKATTWAGYTNNLFATYQRDETSPKAEGVPTWDEVRTRLMNRYKASKIQFPNTLVYINEAFPISDYFRPGVADVISWDYYSKGHGGWYDGVPNSDFLWRWEVGSSQQTFGKTDPSSLSVPVFTFLQSQGEPFSLGSGAIIDILTEQELRGLTYLALTYNLQGIGFFCYRCQEYNLKGLDRNATIFAYYKKMAQELADMNDILVNVPVIAYRNLYFSKGADNVTFTSANSLTKTTVLDWVNGGAPLQKLAWIERRNAADTYLFVVNRDNSPLKDVNIFVKGLNGNMAATTMGLQTSGSSRAGRTLTVTNGKFTDSFDGYAAHVYHICSGTCASPYPNPNPTPTCSDNIQNQGETGIDCGGPCSACSSNPSPSTNSITLKPGWNQISSPIAAGIDLATIESSGCTILPYRSQKLWAWNAQTQTWINPAKVEPFKGYWIYAAYQCTVPLSGTPATFTSLPLSFGWNKISASGTFSAIQGTCTNHITGNWVWHWDKATEKWSHPATMQVDKGYWIKVDQNCVIGS